VTGTATVRPRPVLRPGWAGLGRAGLTVVHLDEAFDPIAVVTGQPTARLAVA